MTPDLETGSVDIPLRRILITGGSGFVGAHLVHFLRATQSKIMVLASGAREFSQDVGVEYRTIDIRKRDEVHALVRDFSPDHIYHLASVSAVNVSWQDPRLTFEVNVLGTYNVFEAAMSLPTAPRILNVSTSQVYAPSSQTLTESSLVKPENPYAASKAMAELLSVQYRKAKDSGIITARSFNHTGPGQSPTFVLPSVAKQVAEIEVGLAVPTLKVGNINVKRDFADVRDVVVAYGALLEKGKTGEVYNVCSGRPVLLADVINQFLSNCKTSITVEVEPVRLRSTEVAQMVGDTTKIRDETGWSPRISLEQTIQDLLNYWRRKVRGRSQERITSRAQ